MKKPKALSSKQARFVAEYLVDFNATKAAERAGYSKKTAYAIGAENLRKPQIQAAIQDRVKARDGRTEVSADRVVQWTLETYQKALAAGKFAAAVAALALLGKHTGAFDPKPEPPPGSSPENPLHVSNQHQLHPNVLRSFVDQLRRAGIYREGVGGIPPNGDAKPVDPQSPLGPDSSSDSGSREGP
jgi:hypothetical protein